MALDQGLDLLHVGGIAHEAEGHPIHVMGQAENQVFAVLIGKGPDRELHIGEIHPLVIGEHPAHGDAAVQGLLHRVDRFDHHFDPAVIEQDAAAGGDLLGQVVVGDRGDGFVAAHLPGGEGKGIAIGQGDWPFGKTT